MFNKRNHIKSNKIIMIMKNRNIDDNLKIDAFLVASKYNLMLVDYLAEPYELTHDNDILLPYLKIRLKKLDYKETAILISSVMMHKHFDCEEVSSINIIYLYIKKNFFALDKSKILIPLLMEDKLNIVEKYLVASVEQQKMFIKLLDSMCSPQSSMLKYFE